MLKLRTTSTLLAAAMVATAAAADSKTVVVSPENMQGWTVATNAGAFAGLGGLQG